MLQIWCIISGSGDPRPRDRSRAVAWGKELKQVKNPEDLTA